MEYKVIYRAYDASDMVGMRTGAKGGNHGEGETGDWNLALNDHAKDNWRVKNSGALQDGFTVIFWALLEKE